MNLQAIMESEMRTTKFANDMMEQWLDADKVLRKIANAKEMSADELRAMAAQGSLFYRKKS